MNLIVDVGNTRIKSAVFEKDRLVEVVTSDKSDFLQKVNYLFEKYKIQEAIISSVSNFSANSLNKLKSKVSVLELNSKTKVPFTNLYETPTTLGVDRIAIVAGAAQKFKNKNVLIIDAGTCITYDFLNKESNYLGGAISPGIQMRYKALNKFTDKLPELEKEIPEKIVGSSTNKSIHSGVIYGVLNEIKGVIEKYQSENELLTIVLTGGDTYFLAKQLKSSIFANPNFVLEGLNAILIYNQGEC
jgi:type III pantothenate kinase